MKTFIFFFLKKVLLIGISCIGLMVFVNTGPLHAQESVDYQKYELKSKKNSVERHSLYYIKQEMDISNSIQSFEVEKLKNRSIEDFLLDGELTFFRDDGFFKITLLGKDGTQYLVYKDVAILNDIAKPISLYQKAFESIAMPDVYIDKVCITAKGCKFHQKGYFIRESDVVLHVTANYELLNTKTQKQLEYHKRLSESPEFIKARQKAIDKINAYNKENGILWIAGETSIAQLPYQSKVNAFGGIENEENTYGWEYYRGGILTDKNIDYKKLDFYDTSTYPYVEHFSWSDRHGIDWNSPHRNQIAGSHPITKKALDVGTCWAQGPLAALEVYANLYYGEKITKQCSLLDVFTCSGGASLSRDTTKSKYVGSSMTAINYIRNNGLVSEEEFPFNNQEVYFHDKYPPCEDKPSVENSVEWLRPAGFKEINPSEDSIGRKQIMEHLIKYGPASAIYDNGNHVMLLTGWGVVKPGKFLEYWGRRSIAIPKDHPLTNKVYFIFKQSYYCDNWGYNGYAFLVRSIRKGNYDKKKACEIYQITSFVGKLEHKRKGQDVVQQPLFAVDNDGDGYYRWGFRGKPNFIEKNGRRVRVPDMQDADDSDPSIHGMNEFGFPIDKDGNVVSPKKADLFMRDRLEDNGSEPFITNEPIWESPDLWVRNRNDDIEEHENPNLTNRQIFVKIKVHNRGNKASSRHAFVSLYWSQAGVSLTRESFEGNYFIQNQKGDSIVTGGFLGKEKIPVLLPGESAIVTLTIQTDSITNPNKFEELTDQAWHYCFLAEIVDLEDPYPLPASENLGKYVSENNNVIQKNVSVIYSYPYYPIPVIHAPFKASVYLPNNSNKIKSYQLECYEEPLIKGKKVATLVNEAEVKIAISQKIDPTSIQGMKSLSKELKTPYLVTHQRATIKNIEIQPKEFAMIDMEVNFLTKKMTDQNEYKYVIQARDSETKQVIGGETYIIKKIPLTNIIAKIDSAVIIAPDKVNIVAKEIKEDVTYRWKDDNNQLIKEGKAIDSDDLQGVRNLKLEVQSNVNGFKDEQTVDLPINNITKTELKLVPNPAQNHISIFFNFDSNSRYACTIVDISGKKVSYSIANNQTQADINISDLTKGSYTLSLYREGICVAEGKFTKE